MTEVVIFSHRRPPFTFPRPAQVSTPQPTAAATASTVSTVAGGAMATAALHTLLGGGGSAAMGGLGGVSGGGGGASHTVSTISILFGPGGFRETLILPAVILFDAELICL